MTTPEISSTASRSWWQTRAFTDGLWLFGFSAVVLFLAIWFEVFPRVAKFSETHERWEIDEIFMTLMVLPVALAIYAARRLEEARLELRRRKEAEKKANEMALHDPLTGLPNRRKAVSDMPAAIEHSAETPAILLVIDLNRFKPVNDLHGHGVGDELLLAVGQRLEQAAGMGATIYRFGGDEFCILICSDEGEQRILSRVETVSASLERPFELQNVTVTIGASIGVTICRDPDTTFDNLMAQADAAMYRWKELGRNGFSFFEAGMEQAALHRARLETELRTALREDRIEPHFQALVRLESQTVIGYEALARWRLADGTYRMPGEFIQIAEETGLISDVFYAVLRKAARAIRDLAPDIRLATNLSPVQFNDPWLVENIMQTLLTEGIAPGRLEIEVTETALVSDYERARNVICSLKNQGIRVSLDDFGTGYSSLRHLSELPFENLKIDKSFIQDLPNDPKSQTIVRAVISMAHSLGLSVTAEGIEDPVNAESVTAYGCDIGQGYLFGRPSGDVGQGSGGGAAHDGAAGQEGDPAEKKRAGGRHQA